MYKYAFLLGRKPLLSVAELVQILSKLSEFIQIEEINKLVLIATFSGTLKDSQALLNRIGGTIRIAEITTSTDKKNNLILQAIPQIATSFAHNLMLDNDLQSKKFKYALSHHTLKPLDEQIIKKTLNNSKIALKEEGLTGRYINKNPRNPALALIKEEKLLKKGAEFNIIEGINQYHFGHTVALQEIDEYSERDYGKPERDPRLGMLPPKLAQIMINLANPSSKGFIYDPFCGLGTVLIEGMHLGYQTLGSDLEANVVERCQKNLEWFTTRHHLSPEQYRLFVKNASRLGKNDISERISAVVSETYLGPPMTQTPTKQQIKAIFAQIEPVMQGFFRSIDSLTPNNTTFVLSLLTYRTKEGNQEKFITMTNLIDEIKKQGFQTVQLIPDELQQKFNLHIAGHHGLLYERPDQVVCRTIFKFVKA